MGWLAKSLDGNKERRFVHRQRTLSLYLAKMMKAPAVVVACTASLANNDEAMVDISHQEEMLGGPTLTVAALPMSEKIVLMEMSQKFHMDHLEKVMPQGSAGLQRHQKHIK